MTIDIDKLVNREAEPLEMVERLQGMIAEVEDCAQALDEAYFSQSIPRTGREWARITGCFHVLLIAVKWVYDLVDAVTEEMAERKRTRALEEKKEGGF